MALETLWFCLIAVLWGGYFLLEGFDFGVGMLLPALPRAERERGQMFESMGLELQPNPAGCCGHAGSFGYETEHYPVSMTIAEQSLVPAIRCCGSDTMIIADGFSCREQIRHGTGRYALHPVEVLDLTLRNERIAAPREIEACLQEAAAAVQPAAAIAALAVTGALLLWLGIGRRSARKPSHAHFRASPSPPLGAERVGGRWGAPGSEQRSDPPHAPHR